MPSLDFEEEKTESREYYAENQKLLLDAEVFFRSLVGSLLSASSQVTPPTVVGRVKDREESIKKFVRKYQSDLEAAKIHRVADGALEVLALWHMSRGRAPRIQVQ
jgi:hypothetical protein